MEKSNARIKKRPRPEWQPSENPNSQKRPTDAEGKNACDVMISPHIMRLLKLVQEGSSDHAKMAAEHLKSVTSGSSPLVLWEVLGRLQVFLTSPEWRTRHNASLAMEGVAQHLPRQDQMRFLHEDHKQDHSNKDLWLTLADLKEGKMETILQNGRQLMSTSEKDYDQLEDEELGKFDSAEKGALQFCERRIELQRRILASRLGLSEILHQVSGNDIQETVRNLIPSNTNEAESNKPRKRKNPQKGIEKSVRALLVMEIKQQEGSIVVSHEKSQTILATELIYRMFDQSWYVRHGSLMGILSLVRAWSVHRSTSCFGIWPQDILARCLCALALDRFGDFSGATNSDMSGGAVAPVREMAGQVFSVVFAMAPPMLQREALEILKDLAKDKIWEVRHGALIALKYAGVLVHVLESQSRWPQEFVDSCFMVAISRLGDGCDDVQGVAARLLNSVLLCEGRGSNKQLRTLDITHIVAPLWKAVAQARLVSSAIIDLVQLFSTLVGRNCSLVLSEISNCKGTWDSFRRILERLHVLLTCEYLSVKKSIIRSTGTVVEHLASFCRTSDLESDDDRKAMDAAFCDIVKRTYTLYCYCSSCDTGPEYNSKRIALTIFCQDLWTVLVQASQEILKDNEEDVRRVQSYLVLRYFDLDDRASQPEENTNVHEGRLKALSGPRLQMQTHIAQAISSFLMNSVKFSRLRNAPDFLELCLCAALESPFTADFESGCILFHALFGRNENKVFCKGDIRSMKVFCDGKLQKALETDPFCIIVQRSRVLESDFTLVAVLDKAFAGGVELVKSRSAGGKEAAEAVVKLWKTTLQSRPLEYAENRHISVDSMRVSVSMTGAVIAGGHECFPEKLSPLVRSLMTSIQNDQNESCRKVTCSYLVELIDVIIGPMPSEKRDAYTRTCGKIVINLRNMVASQVIPGAIAASSVIGLLSQRLSRERLLIVLRPVLEALLPLKDSEPTDTQRLRRALLLLEAVFMGLGRGRSITEYVISTYCKSVSKLGCIAQDPWVRKISSEFTRRLCTFDASLTLQTTLPGLVALMKEGHDSHRLKACQLVRDCLETSAMDICPFVRSLLPLAMSMMTDPVEECARTAASIFSCLVQVAPVVQDTASLAIDSLSGDRKAELVIDHLIHGKALPHCDLHPLIIESLNATKTVLRNYQLDGISWLHFLQTMNLNGALCDSMGLGKTLQALVGVALSHLDAGEEEEPISLIVCPSSVVGHWLGEINRFFPGRKIFRPAALYGNEKQRRQAWSGGIPDSNIVVTSYAVLRSDVAKLESINWRYCILDEGHLLKNPKTMTARASRRLKTQHKLILTGTPVQNKVFEVWSTFDFLMPNFLGTSSSFSKEFANPITKGQSTGATALDVATSIEKLKLLHQQVLPFILRREKEHVLQELPPKIITTILCEMSPLQTQLYSNFCSGAVAKKSLDSLERAVTSANNPNRGNDFSMGSDVLKSFLYLRLLCTYPALVHTEADRWVATEHDSVEFSGKLLALSELLRTAGIQSQTHKLTAADNDSSLVYCNSEDDAVKNEVDEFLDTNPLDTPTISLDTYQTSSGSKCLIFAQFTRSLDVVESLLLKQVMGSNVGYVRLDGRVPLDQRSKLVDRFNTDESIRVMLLTTRIGGLGLNLTAADTVILLEHDWNPHVDLQSMDRAHRIGQKRNVHVYRLVTSGSIEEKIMKLHEVKLKMSEAIVNSENSTIFSMGTDRLLDIFRFRSEAGKGSESSKDLSTTLDSLVERYEDEYRDLSERVFFKGFTEQEEGVVEEAEAGIPEGTGI